MIAASVALSTPFWNCITMKKILATLAAGAMLAAIAAAPASAAGFKIKSGVSAKDAGRCAAATVLFAS